MPTCFFELITKLRPFLLADCYKVLFIKAWLLIALFILFSCNQLLGQEGENKNLLMGNKIVEKIDSNKVINADSTKVDTIKPINKKESSVLDAKVDYQAEDSITIDLKKQLLFLYGKADVKYEKMNLQSAQIQINMENGNVYSNGITDSTGKLIETPVFKDDQQEYKAQSMVYNMNSKKGLIKEILTNEGESYIHGEVVKRENDSIMFIKNGKYTTCNNPNPHFHIHASKLKFISDDKIVTGPAYLSFDGIPTPLVLPFGYFPNKKGRANGIIFPEFGESPGLGFSLRNGGYYMGLGDFVDLAILGDIYSKGSYGLGVASNYKVRYKFSGLVGVNYSNFKQGFQDYNFSENETYSFRWTHKQDFKAHPTQNFSADVNFNSRNFNQLNNLNTNQFVTNTFQSSINYTKSFDNSPFIINASARQSQNTTTKSQSLTLPQVNVIMNRWFPFKGKTQVGSPKAHQKIGLSYTGDFRNDLTIADSLLFKREAIQRMQNGVQHFIPITFSSQVLKYFSFAPSLNFRSKWYFKTIEKSYDAETNSTKTDTIGGFDVKNEADFNMNLSTKIYGMYAFKKGKISAIRHVITPTIGFVLKPDFSTLVKGNYGVDQREISYSPYEISPFGAPSVGQQGNLRFNLINNLEMKVKDDNDTIGNGFKKIKIFENFDISNEYNFLKDSFQLNDFRVSARTILFKNLSIVANAIINPYKVDAQKRRRIDEYQFSQNKLGDITNANIAFSFSARSKQKITPKEEIKTELVTEEELDMIRNNPNYYVDFNIPWTLNLNYTLSYNKSINLDTTKSLYNQLIIQNLQVNGDFNLTKYWKIGFNTGFDIQTKKVTNTALNIYRDLHCWEMRFDWVPFGFNRSYTLTINVKSSILQDLKLSRRRSWYDY